MKRPQLTDLIAIATLALITLRLTSCVAYAQGYAPWLRPMMAKHERWTPLQLSPLFWLESENNAEDSSGNGRDGSWQSTAAYTNAVVGQGFAFDPLVNNIVTVADSAAIRPGTGAFSIAGWFRTTDGDAREAFVGKRTTTSPFTMIFIAQGTSNADGSTTNSRRFRFWIIGTSDTQQDVRATTDSDYADGSWRHVAFTRTGRTFLLYVDGSSVAYTINRNLGTQTEAIDVNTTADWGIGGLIGVNRNRGADDVMYFNRVLTAAEVKQLYDESKVREPRTW